MQHGTTCWSGQPVFYDYTWSCNSWKLLVQNNNLLSRFCLSVSSCQPALRLRKYLHTSLYPLSLYNSNYRLGGCGSVVLKFLVIIFWFTTKSVLDSSIAICLIFSVWNLYWIDILENFCVTCKSLIEDKKKEPLELRAEWDRTHAIKFAVLLHLWVEYFWLQTSSIKRGIQRPERHETWFPEHLNRMQHPKFGRVLFLSSWACAKWTTHISDCTPRG